MKRLLLRITGICASAYAMICLVMTGCQSRLLYVPDQFSEADALTRAGANGMEAWRDAKGKLLGWRRPAPQAKARMLVFHGNAGSALDRTYYSEALGGLWEVCIMEYPGYGSRRGIPGKMAFITAGRAAVENLMENDKRPIFVLGESVGSGTAAALAGSMPDEISGALLVIPFARMVEVAKAKFPWLPVSLMLRDKFDNIAALDGFVGPLVTVIAEEDEVVGAAQGRKLHESYPGPKKLITLPEATHNDFPTGPDARWFREASTFLLR